MASDDIVALEIMLNRFNRLMVEVLRGTIARNSFFPWEVAILLDLDTCQLERRRRGEILRQYQRAVERQMQMGPGPPMKLSEFLEFRAHRREAAGLRNEAAPMPG
jgi:hypothetical protein